jgi:hypothetical protein
MARRVALRRIQGSCGMNRVPGSQSYPDSELG